MFDGLSSKLSQVFDGLKRKGSLRASDVEDALRDIRLALLEADVALPAVKEFIEKVKEQAVGASAIKTVSTGQQVVKIVHDALILMLAGEVDEEGKAKPAALNLLGPRPAVILMVGLQGSGKTTSTAKLAHYLTKNQKQKVLMASLDVQRPAAQEQLRQLAEKGNLNALPIIAGQDPISITKRAVKAASLGGYDVLLLDSAGRLTIDDALMSELKAVKQEAHPIETMLVADAMTGQDAARTGLGFHEKLGISSIILTRIDGDARGGAALSMRHVTGCPIKFLGVGEAIEALDVFDAERVAGRILDMGDIVALVEKAANSIDQETAEKLARKMQKGRFDLNDMATQLKQMKDLGGASAILGLMPGMGKMMKQIDPSRLDGKVFARQEAIIRSMTKLERRNPEILHASRKKRIAAGSGTSAHEINKLLKQYEMMAKMMKQMSKGGGGMMGAISKMMGVGGGGMPSLGSMGNTGMGAGGNPFGSAGLPSLGNTGLGAMGTDKEAGLGSLLNANPRTKQKNKKRR